MKIRNVKFGEPIIMQGDTDNCIYKLDRGSVRVLDGGLDGKELLIKRFDDEFPYFGEMALFSQTPRSATVVANEDCVVYEFTTDEFMGYLNIDLAVQLDRMTMKQICVQMRKMLEMAPEKYYDSDEYLEQTKAVFRFIPSAYYEKLRDDIEQLKHITRAVAYLENKDRQISAEELKLHFYWND